MPKERFLVRRVGSQETTSGGIEIPKTAQEKIPHGTVVIAGDHEDMCVQIEEGDTLVFSHYSGTAVKIEGEMLLVIEPKDILLVLKK